jgi:hypothetical protein
LNDEVSFGITLSFLAPETSHPAPIIPAFTTLIKRMNIQTANALFNNGTFMEMYKAGFITDKVFLYREIYLWIEAQLETRSISLRKAVLEAEVKFDKGNRTVWRAYYSFSGAAKTVAAAGSN